MLARSGLPISVELFLLGVTAEALQVDPHQPFFSSENYAK